MAPKKRVLADSNASARPAKRSTRHKASGKENDAPGIDSVKPTGNGAIDTAMPSKKKAEEEEEWKHPAEKIQLWDAEHPNAISEYVYIVFEQPEDARPKRSKKVSNQPAEKPLDWKWTMTRSAIALYERYHLESQKRDNDFSTFSNGALRYGCGQREAIENMVQAAYNEFKSKEFDLDRFWVHIQAIGLWFHNNDLYPLSFTDDRDRVTDVLKLIGTLVLSALNKLERQDLLKEGSRIRNIALVLSLFIELAENEKDEGYDPTVRCVSQWAGRILAYANHHNLELSDKTGVFGTSWRVSRFSGSKITYDKFRKEGEDRWALRETYNKYCEAYSFFYHLLRDRLIGGDMFDLTKRTKAELA